MTGPVARVAGGASAARERGRACGRGGPAGERGGPLTPARRRHLRAGTERCGSRRVGSRDDHAAPGDGSAPTAQPDRSDAREPGPAGEAAARPARRTSAARFGDLTAREITVLTPLVVLIIVLGVYPQPVLDVINPTAERTMVDVGFTDPPPAVDARSREDSDEPRHRRDVGRRSVRHGPDRPDHAPRRSTSADRHAGADRARRRVHRRSCSRRSCRGRRATPARSRLTVLAVVAALVWTVVAGHARHVRRDVRRRGRGRRGDLRDVGRAAGARPAVGAADGRPGSEPGGAFVTRGGRAGRLRPRRGWPPGSAAPMQTEVFPLALFAVGGMMVFPAASDLVTLFVALEVLSLPLYLMCGLARRRRLISQEVGGQVLPARRVHLGDLPLRAGAALRLRGFDVVRRDRHPGPGGRGQRRAAARRAWRWCVVGLLFKASVGPFHLWTPDVYQGAPTPVTAFMAACTKVAAFAAMLRVCLVALEPMAWSWQPVLAIVAGRLDGDRFGHRHHPDRHEADAGLLVGRARRVHPARRAGDVASAVRRRRCSTCSPTAWRRSAPSPS